jgi:hypothetical protein
LPLFFGGIMNKFTYIEMCLRDAGIAWTEAAKYIFPVNRQTLYRWSDGGEARNKYLYDRTIILCNVIKQATKDGHFPLGKMGKQERAVAIKRVVDSYSA